MFFVKKWLSAILAPLPLGLGIAIFGLYLLCFTARQRTGKTLLAVALAGLLLFSSGPVADTLVSRFEDQYPAFNANNLPAGFTAKYVVVLGGGHVSDPRQPSTSQLNPDSLGRLIEGVRIYRQIPGSRLLLSGGTVYDPAADAEIMAWVARDIGVAGQDIVLETQSRDTHDQARIIREIIGSEPFVLVTSASHLPRSMALFHRQGMNPYPAPAQFMVREHKQISPGYFLPTAGSLYKSSRAAYETLGLIWGRLRGLL